MSAITVIEKISWNGKVVGEYNHETRTYTRKGVRDEHFVRVIKGYGVQDEIVRLKLEPYCCEWFVIEREMSDGSLVELSCPFKFLLEAEPIVLNANDGLQRFVPESLFHPVVLRAKPLPKGQTRFL